jgi:hypothetical protein
VIKILINFKLLNLVQNNIQYFVFLLANAGATEARNYLSVFNALVLDLCISNLHTLLAFKILCNLNYK